MALIKKRLTIGYFLLILVNLIPLYGVWFENWNASEVFLIYCLETVMLGIVNVFKMIVASTQPNPETGEKKQPASALFLIVFFIFHYGFFVFVQTQIFFKISKLLDSDEFIIPYSQVFAVLGYEGKLLLGIFSAYYILDFFFNFILNGAYQKSSISKLMVQPYLRIFVQQFVVILGGFFLLFNSGRFFIILFIAVKTIFEYRMYTGKFVFNSKDENAMAGSG